MAGGKLAEEFEPGDIVLKTYGLIKLKRYFIIVEKTNRDEYIAYDIEENGYIDHFRTNLINFYKVQKVA